MPLQRSLHALCIFLFMLSCNLQRQHQLPPLEITWNVLEKDHNGSGRTLSEMILHNPSEKHNFPAEGWTIYFNSDSPQSLGEDSLYLQITHINGDFFKLTPGKLFEGIAPKESFHHKIVSRKINNVSDYGNGFYIVYDSVPDNPIVLSYRIDSELNYADDEKSLALHHFYQNQAIRELDLDKMPPILPTPYHFVRGEGAFDMNGQTTIVADNEYREQALLLADELNKLISGEISVGTTAGKNSILLQKDTNPNAEGYDLKIMPNQITISASTPTGIFYGIQSVKSMLPPAAWQSKQKNMMLPSIHIKDKPRFAYRAFMMDISRNFQPKSQILKTIDVLALYKINVLHFHFNDDEGWRIEIDGLPELTEVGARRGHTLNEEQHLFPSYGSGPNTDNPFGSGYLTRTDFIEILRYAHARNIRIIPEYETPGHARAAIKSMDVRYARLMKEGKKAEAEQYLLRDLDDRSVYRSIQGFNDNIINPALPSAYNFIEKIIDETVAMYKEAGAPLHTIHFGGDEVPEGVWEKSPAVIDLLKRDPNIESVDELWHYYFTKVNAMLKERGLYLSGWEEIGLRKQLVDGRKKMVLDPRFGNENFHVDVWNNLEGNEDLAYLLANAGYKVVLTNATNMYMDLAYDRSYHEIGQYWGGYVDIDKLFSFIPYDYYKNQRENRYGKPLPANHYDGKIRLDERSKENIVGLQAPLWSEIITSREKFEYLFLPKIFGLAERAWAPDPEWAAENDMEKTQSLYQDDWSAFIYILGTRELPKLDHYAGGFAYRIPTPGYRVVNNMVEANVLYPNMIVRYTEDGSDPTSESKQYVAPVPYSEGLKLKVFNEHGRSGRTVRVVL